MIKSMQGIAFIGLMVFATPVFAEDVSIRTLCQMLPQHIPDASVNYTPGNDVHGRMVVPADVNKVLRSNYDAVEIPVEYSVLQNMNFGLPAGSQVQPTVAILRVYHDGRVQYNGQDVTPQAQSLCVGMPQDATNAHANIQMPQNGNYNPNMEPKVLGQLQYSNGAQAVAAIQPSRLVQTPKNYVLRNPQDIP